MLDRLVRGPILAQPNGVVGEHEDRADSHQRRHAQRTATVVGKREKCSAVRDEAAVQRDAIHDRRHGELAHAVIEVVTAAIARNRLRA